MTIKRKVYFRKKGKEYVWEGKMNGKTEFLIQKPTDDEKFLHDIGRLINSLTPEQLKLVKSSFFSKDKWLLLSEKLSRLDYRYSKDEEED